MVGKKFVFEIKFYEFLQKLFVFLCYFSTEIELELMIR